MYQIKLEQFEGPLDLLLQLIEKNELDITRLSLARVADQFVFYMEEHKDIAIEQMADFLDTAARLLLLKSKALLPILQFTEEEEEEIVDLEERLKIYALFKEKVPVLGEMAAREQWMFSREAYVGLSEMFLPDISKLVLSLEDVRTALYTLLETIPDPEKLKEKILRRTVRLEEKIKRLKEYIVQRGNFMFFEMVRDRSDRGEIIVSFLAVLELVRQQHMTVRQEDYFGDMYVERMKNEI